MEEIFAGTYDYDEEIPYSPDFDEHAAVFDLKPGEVVSRPPNAPHRVENLDTRARRAPIRSPSGSIRWRRSASAGSGASARRGLASRLELRGRVSDEHGIGGGIRRERRDAEADGERSG